MTSVRRSDESAFAAIPNEPEAAAPVAARPTTRSSPAVAANRVEAHKATAGTLRPVDAELVKASTDLVKGYIHPSLFDRARPDLAQKELNKLPAREFSAVLGKLEQSGSLDRLLGQMSAEQKGAFFDTAVRKGALQRQAGHPVEGPFNPPPKPSTYAIPASAPNALAKAANQSNLDVSGNYYKAHEAYFERYEAAAKSCQSGAALRAIGPPAAAALMSDDVSPSHPQAGRLSAQWLNAHRIPSEAWLHKTVSNKLSDFMGEAHAGGFFIEGKLDLEVANKKIGLEASGRISDTGKTEGKASGKAKLPMHVMVGLDSKGTAMVGGHVEGASVAVKGGKVVTAIKEGPVAIEMEQDITGRASKLKAQVSGNGFTYDNGRGQVDVSLGEKVGGYGFYQPRTLEFGGGVKGKLESGEDSVSYQLGYGMQGLTHANANHALNQLGGVWATPVELTQGKEWNELGARTQDSYRRLGWTAEEWSTKVVSRG